MNPFNYFIWWKIRQDKVYRHAAILANLNLFSKKMKDKSVAMQMTKSKGALATVMFSWGILLPLETVLRFCIRLWVRLYITHHVSFSASFDYLVPFCAKTFLKAFFNTEVFSENRPRFQFSFHYLKLFMWNYYHKCAFKNKLLPNFLFRFSSIRFISYHSQKSCS